MGKIITVLGKTPKIHPSAFIAETAVISGDVTIAANCSIWFGVVIRGDVAPVIIGENVNIQDNSVLHQSKNLPLVIENDVTIGHMCILHSCTIRKNSLIGMGSILLDNCEIKEGCIIGAGSLVPERKKIIKNSLCYGRPIKIIRTLRKEEHEDLRSNISHYIKMGNTYKAL